MRSSRIKLLSSLAVLAFFGAACGGGGGTPAPSATSEEESAAETESGAAAAEGDGVLAFGALLPETGSLAFLGPPEIAGVRLAVEEVNAAGGVLGQDVTISLGDSGDTSTDIATQTTDRHLAAGVDAIVGAASSGVSLTVIDKITGAGVIQFSPANTSAVFSTYDDNGLYFRTAPPDDLQGRVLGELVANDGHASAVVMSLDDAYGNGLREATAAAFEASGGTVLDSFAYDPQATNFDAEVQQVVSANPDAVVVVGFDESARILQGLIQAGFSPDVKGLYGADGNMANSLPGQVDPANPAVLQGMKGTTPLPAENEAFFTRLQEFAPDLTERAYAPESYDAIIIMALAAEVAGSDAGTAVAAEINGVTKDGEKCTDFQACKDLVAAGTDIDYDGASGPGEFVDAGEPGAGNYAILEFGAGGTYTQVGNVEASF